MRAHADHCVAQRSDPPPRCARLQRHRGRCGSPLVDPPVASRGSSFIDGAVSVAPPAPINGARRSESAADHRRSHLGRRRWTRRAAGRFGNAAHRRKHRPFVRQPDRRRDADASDERRDRLCTWVRSAPAKSSRWPRQCHGQSAQRGDYTIETDAVRRSDDRQDAQRRSDVAASSQQAYRRRDERTGCIHRRSPTCRPKSLPSTHRRVRTSGRYAREDRAISDSVAARYVSREVDRLSGPRYVRHLVAANRNMATSGGRRLAGRDWAPYRYGRWIWIVAVGLDLDRRRAVGIRAVALRPLGLYAQSLVLGAGSAARARDLCAGVGRVGRRPGPAIRTSQSAGSRSGRANPICPAIARRGAIFARSTRPTSRGSTTRHSTNAYHGRATVFDYRNRSAPHALTIVSHDAFVSGHRTRGPDVRIDPNLTRSFARARPRAGHPTESSQRARRRTGAAPARRPSRTRTARAGVAAAIQRRPRPGSIAARVTPDATPCGVGGQPSQCTLERTAARSARRARAARIGRLHARAGRADATRRGTRRSTRPRVDTAAQPAAPNRPTWSGAAARCAAIRRHRSSCPRRRPRLRSTRATPAAAPREWVAAPSADGQAPVATPRGTGRASARRRPRRPRPGFRGWNRAAVKPPVPI